MHVVLENLFWRSSRKFLSPTRLQGSYSKGCKIKKKTFKHFNFATFFDLLAPPWGHSSDSYGLAFSHPKGHPSISPLPSPRQSDCLHLGPFTRSTRRNEFRCCSWLRRSHGNSEPQLGHWRGCAILTRLSRNSWNVSTESGVEKGKKRGERGSLDLDIAADTGKKKGSLRGTEGMVLTSD